MVFFLHPNVTLRKKKEVVENCLLCFTQRELCRLDAITGQFDNGLLWRKDVEDKWKLHYFTSRKKVQIVTTRTRNSTAGCCFFRCIHEKEIQNLHISIKIAENLHLQPFFGRGFMIGSFLWPKNMFTVFTE